MTHHSLWSKKKVLITGHTGFKGAWLAQWLSMLGAEVHGIALDPPTFPSIFEVANIKSVLASDHRIDIQNLQSMREAFTEIKPTVVFHLAAQSLVQYSYIQPIETYSVNVLGTAHVLESIRECQSVNAAVIVTTDKCYENLEQSKPFREDDRLGGADPYSSSKACAEIVSSAYQASYFNSDGLPRIATARAGNVIGGGDWALNRLVPDCITAHLTKQPLILRYPNAIRPWQHVLESLNGYILLAEKLLGEKGKEFVTAWNFGPELDDMLEVEAVAKMIQNELYFDIEIANNVQFNHESCILKIDSTKARQHLHWQPQWNLIKAITATTSWYKHWLGGEDMHQFTRDQIVEYTKLNKSTMNDYSLVEAVL